MGALGFYECISEKDEASVNKMIVAAHTALKYFPIENKRSISAANT
jgi:hypothetical protein